MKRPNRHRPYTQVVSTRPADTLVGTLLDGRYRIVDHIADGGMAHVYRGVDTRLDRDVALKIMRPHLVHDETFVARFRREARSAARLSHPHIVAVHDQGEDDGRMFLAMEYVPGRTLREVLDERGALTPREALDIIDPVLDALATAHRAGLIHRDVKPENVILREDGVVKVADFGLARSVGSHTATSAEGMLMGTVSYLSPEQVERGIADPRSDVYAAGLVLVEMLTGAKVFDGETPITIAYQHVHGGVPRLGTLLVGTPAELDAVVGAATARDPDDRPVDAGAFRDAVRGVIRSLPAAFLDTTATPRGLPEPSAASSRDTTQELVRVTSSDTARLPVLSAMTPPEGIRRSAEVVATPARPMLAEAGPRRRRWPWVLVALATLLLAGTSWFFLAGPGKAVTIPEVATQPIATAQQTLTDLGLTTSTREEFSEEIAAGQVISTDPSAGTSIWRLQPVTLVVSKGLERYAVPTIEGTPLEEALSALTAANLAGGTQTQDWSETVPEGSVISATPAAGELLKRDTPVDLVVSKGRQPIDITDYTGKPLAEAAAAFEGAGLVVDSSGHENSSTVAQGSIIRQDPASGTLFKGDTVTVVVSDGPPLKEVPNVVGKQVNAAKAILEAAGFEVKVENLFGGIFGTVRFQDPGPSEKVPEGSTITISAV